MVWGCWLAVPLWLLTAFFAIALLLRRSRMAFFPLTVLMLNLPLGKHYFPLSLRKVTAQGNDTLTITSWNVDNFALSTDTLRSAAAAMLRFDPDVICLQERPHHNLLAWDSIRAQFPSHPYVVRNMREDEVLNLAILSRYPLKNSHAYYFPQSYNKQLQADVLFRGHWVRLFNVHLQTAGFSSGSQNAIKLLLHDVPAHTLYRNRQAAFLRDRAGQSPYPVVACGDFNDTRSSLAYILATESLKDAADLADAFALSYPSSRPFVKIDYVFHSPSVSVCSYSVVPTPQSDHRLQVCRLLLPPNRRRL